MAEGLVPRCKRICGPEMGKCFIANPKQLTCLADMVINNAYGISAALEALRCDGLPEAATPMVEEAMAVTDDLIDWIKYLQVTHDIRGLAMASATGPQSDRRGDRRYPFPEEFNEFVELEVLCRGSKARVQIVNFSRGGLQFLCPGLEGPLRADSRIACRLSSSHRAGRSVEFEALIKYVMAHEDTHYVGVMVEAAVDRKGLDFFRNILDFLAQLQAARHVLPPGADCKD